MIKRIFGNFKIIEEFNIFFSNAIKDGGVWQILFLNETLLNHSCAPNAFMSTINESGETWCEVRAIKDISKGEEVTVFYQVGQEYSYQAYGCNTKERKLAIQKHFGFDCKCDVCSGKVSEQEDIIKELLKLHKALDQLSKNPSNLAQEVQTWEKIVDLNLKLYIGDNEDKIQSMEALGAAAKQARNEELFKKAWDGLKKLTTDWKIDRLVQWSKENNVDV